MNISFLMLIIVCCNLFVSCYDSNKELLDEYNENEYIETPTISLKKTDMLVLPKAELIYRLEGFYEGNYAQGIAIYKNILFFFNHGGHCRLVDLSEKKIVGEYDLDTKSEYNHVNNANFSQKFIENNKYPLIYISECKGDGRCFVEQLSDETSVLVQTISLHSNFNCNLSNWILDEKNKKLYLLRYSDEKTGTICMFDEFNLPSLMNKHIVLSSEDVVRRYSFEYVIWQGAVFRNGYLYLVYGNDITERGIMVINFEDKLYCDYNFTHVIKEEAEGIGFWNEEVIVTTINGYVYRMQMN